MSLAGTRTRVVESPGVPSLDEPTERHFALLGVSWAAFEDSGRSYPIPNGNLSWIGWQVDDEHALNYIGDSDSRDVDRRIDPGRCLISVRLPDTEAADAATAVADAVAGMLSSPQSPIEVETSVVPISAADVAAGFVNVSAVRADPEVFSDPVDALVLNTDNVMVGKLPPVLERLNVVLRDGGDKTGLLPALVFWRLAVDEWAFAPEDVRWGIEHSDERFITRIDQARAEQSVQNAFKAFEALIGGEPPKDQKKLSERLRAIGLDPDVAVPIPDGQSETLLQRLTRIRDLRDARAAHGGRTRVSRRSLSWQELIETHRTVWHCIYERIEYLLAEDLGSP